SARDRHQLLAQRALEVGHEDLGRHLLLADTFDRGREQPLLVLIVAVDRELRNTGGRGDRVHAGAVETLGREQALGGLQDRCVFLQVLGAARTAGFGYGKRDHVESNTRQYSLVMVYYTTAFNIL